MLTSIQDCGIVALKEQGSMTQFVYETGTSIDRCLFSVIPIQAHRQHDALVLFIHVNPNLLTDHTSCMTARTSRSTMNKDALAIGPGGCCARPQRPRTICRDSSQGFAFGWSARMDYASVDRSHDRGLAAVLHPPPHARRRGEHAPACWPPHQSDGAYR